MGAWAKVKMRRIFADRSGNFSVLTAMAMLPLLAGASLTLDLADAYLQAKKMQAALDSAALAAVKFYGEGSSSTDTTEAAKRTFFANFTVPDNSETLVEGDETSGFSIEMERSPYEDVVSTDYGFNFKPTFLQRFPFRISRRSVAARVPGIEACILALHPSKYRSFEVSGSADVDMSGCTITANSIDQQAIYVGGTGKLKAECLFSSGGISIDPSAVTLACEKPHTESTPVPDPFKHRKLPYAGSLIDLSGCGQNYVGGGGGGGNCNGTGRTPSGNNAGYVVTLKPGSYANLDLKGAIKLEAGAYIIDGGSLQIGSQAVVTGHDVTFFLLNQANVSIHGGATFDITPALSGNWSGFSIVAEHANTAAAMINGNSLSSLTGIIYMPDAQEIQYSGNGSTSGECIRLIAQSITLIGNSTFKMDCKRELANVTVNNPGSIRLVQ